jgi:hypothetical protein
MFRKSLVLLPAVLLVAISGFACGDDDDGGGGATTSAAGGGTAVSVELNEFTVTIDPDSVPAGEIEFSVENIGGETHEFVVVKTDLAEDALPTAPDGSFDEEGEGVEVVDEIEDIASKTTQTLTVDLEAGAYVLVCNIVDETEGESHYAEGMHTSLTVE